MAVWWMHHVVMVSAPAMKIVTLTASVWTASAWTALAAIGLHQTNVIAQTTMSAPETTSALMAFVWATATTVQTGTHALKICATVAPAATTWKFPTA